MRLDGVGVIRVAGGDEYAMRVWLDIEKMRHVNLTAGSVIESIRSQSLQVAAGVIGQPPNDETGAFQPNVTTQGRLLGQEDVRNIILKRGSEGRICEEDIPSADSPRAARISLLERFSAGSKTNRFGQFANLFGMLILALLKIEIVIPDHRRINLIWLGGDHFNAIDPWSLWA